MNKRKLLVVLASLTLIGVTALGVTLAYFTDADSKRNVITMGKVDVSLEEPEFSKNPDNTVENVKPGDVITKDPTIFVAEDSEDAYIRVKFQPSELTDVQFQQLLEGININQDLWVLGDGGYYYYQKKVTAGDQPIIFFDEVKIPPVWGNETSQLKFNLDISVEAIQADNFETQLVMDGTKVIGWGEVDIQPAI